MKIRNTIALLLMVVYLLSASSVFAEDLDFGTPKAYWTFDGPGKQIFYDESHYFSTEFPRSKTKSVKIVCKYDNIEDMNVSFKSVEDISHEVNFYAEVYVNSKDGIYPPATVFWAHDDGGIYNNAISFKDSGYVDENGWKKYEAYIPTGEGQQYGKSTMISLRGYYVGNVDHTFYFDDLAIRYAPARIEASNVNAKSDDVINLNDMRIYGYDNLGNKARIRTNGVANWTVMSGNATVDHNDNLVLDNKNGGTVTVKVDFCGVSTTFDINLVPSLEIQAPEILDGKNSIPLNNMSNEDKDISAVFVLFDGENRIYDTKFTRITAGANTKTYLNIPEFNIPFDMKDNYHIKAICYTNKRIESGTVINIK